MSATGLVPIEDRQFYRLYLPALSASVLNCTCVSIFKIAFLKLEGFIP